MDKKEFFTKRELDIITRLMQGKSNKQISLELSISQRTVEYHITHIFSKLNVSSRTEAVIKLSENQLRETVSPPERILRNPVVDFSPIPPENEANSSSKRRETMKKVFYFIVAFALVIALAYIANKSINGSSKIKPAVIPEPVAENTIMQSILTPKITAQPIFTTVSPTKFVPTPTATFMYAALPTETETIKNTEVANATWEPSVVSPVFPNENIYLQPLSLKFGAWPATAGCPNTEGLEDYAGLLPEVVVDTVQHMAVGTREAEMQWTDPAYWPVLINPFAGKTITQEWINKIARADKSPYAQLITAQCGEETTKLSWWVQMCPGPCETNGTSQALMTNVFMINRKQWLVWAIQ
jgi:DNA-binding CsgD family transcriptional regulator